MIELPLGAGRRGQRDLARIAVDAARFCRQLVRRVVNGALFRAWLSPRGAALWRSLALLLAFGGFMAAIGAFDTDGASLVRRFAYWSMLMATGGVAHTALEAVLARLDYPKGFLKRGVLLAALMTVPMTPIVWVASGWMFGAALAVGRLGELVPGVLLVCSAVVGALGVSKARRAEPATPVGPVSVPAGMRELLPYPLRRASLYALQAEDHYVRVHTNVGSALVRMRMADALAALDSAPGFKTHRSWWVAEAAIRDVCWRRGSGFVRLENDLEVPVSRSFARDLAKAGRL